jgi:Lrp/AsnC family transcriptional regulator
MQHHLDRVDRRILALLQADASLTAADVAARVGLSQSPCWRRIARLEREGLIRSRVALLDRDRLGLGVVVFAQVKFARGARQSLAEFEEAVRGFTEVQECFMLMGEVDFLLKVVTRDVAAYERFLREKLSLIPAVLEVRSSMALSVVKEGTALPLELLEAMGEDQDE